MPTKAYSKDQVDQMLADLRVLDARIIDLESITWFDNPTERRANEVAIKAAKRKQKALAAKVWRITGRAG